MWCLCDVIARSMFEQRVIVEHVGGILLAYRSVCVIAGSEGHCDGTGIKRVLLETFT